MNEFPENPHRDPAWRRLLVNRPVFLLAAIVVAQTAFTLNSRPLLYSDEVRHADVLQNMLCDGDLLRLTLNGRAYPDKPPLYFWFLAGLATATGMGVETAMFVGVAVSVFALSVATWALGRAALPRREDGLTAALLLLGCGTIVAAAHYARMDQMFAALITAAHACMLLGLRRKSFSGWVVAGFAAMALAALVKGPFAVGFVLPAAVGYLLWSGRLRRLLKLDFLTGLAVLCVVIVGWLTAAWFQAGRDYVENIVFRQTFERAVDSFRHAEPWWFYLPVMPFLLLPWTSVLAVLPWSRLGDAGLLRRLAPGSRSAESPRAYLCWALVMGFAMLSAVSIKTPAYPLPLLPPAMVLIAAFLGGTSPSRSAAFFLIAAGIIAAQAIAAGFADQLIPLPVEVRGGALLASMLATGAFVLLILAWQRPIVPALFAALLGIVAGNILAGEIAPSLAPALSPREQARQIARYADAGFAPLTYETYPGIYSFYAGRQIPETFPMFRDKPNRKQHLREYVMQFLSQHDQAVVAMSERRWREHWRPILRRIEQRESDLQGMLTVVHTQWIEDQPYVLVLWSRSSPQERPQPVIWDGLVRFGPGRGSATLALEGPGARE
ncbi:MAG: ArnT family glycosyltransferase [Phycisphaerae bacterium]